MGSLFILLIELVVIVAAIAATWKVYQKAGYEGWESIVPIYNIYVLCKIVGKPGWYMLLLLIPFVNIVVGVVIYARLARSFGKESIFALALFFLVGWFILAFNDENQYIGPNGEAAPGGDGDHLITEQ